MLTVRDEGMHHHRHTYRLAPTLASFGLFVASAACTRPASEEGEAPPSDGFSRYPATEPVLNSTPELVENPWIAGFGGATHSDIDQTGGRSGQGSASGGAAPATTGTDSGAGGEGVKEPGGGSTVLPDGSGGGGDHQEPEPLIERRLDRYLEGEGTDKLLGLWGEPGTSPVECRIEIYSNGGVEPWRTIVLPNEFPESGSLTLCSIPADHPECTGTLSGSLYNGNDALVLSCGEVVMDSFGRVGEDPGASWMSEDKAIRSEGQDLARCSQTGRADPFSSFEIEDDWVRVENDESLEEARRRCTLFEAPGEGGAGAFSP